jgi:DNA-binding MarR family transcriptional regulator
MSLCEEPLINRFFSILGRLGIFGLLLEPAHDLTLHQLRVLFHLHYHGDRTMGQISAKLQVSDPTATGVIDRLVERELVERAADPDDRRRVLVRLTASGREHVLGMRSAGAETAGAVFGQLSSTQREALFAAVEPVYRLLSPPSDPEEAEN